MSSAVDPIPQPGRNSCAIGRYSAGWGDGGELGNRQRHTWHWGDGTVESFNADLGYAEMIRQMLAADELYPTDSQKLRASGYLARPYFLFNRTTFGRAIYAIGNRERAAFLSGVDTQRVVMIAFAISGGLSAFGGELLAGYASKAAQAMGDAYLLPSIAAVVLGGTSILGGRGSYLGTVAGVILITLLQSILSVMQMPEAGRQVIYGVVIIAMLLLYGRERRHR